MISLSHASSTDDINVVFEALSEWCHLHKVDPDSLEGRGAASMLFDLFQLGYDTKESLLAAMDRSNPDQHLQQSFPVI